MANSRADAPEASRPKLRMPRETLHIERSPGWYFGRTQPFRAQAIQKIRLTISEYRVSNRNKVKIEVSLFDLNERLI
jgi:hypothetical protein